MEISFKDIGRVLKKNIAFILILSIVFAACSFLFTNFVIKKTYKTSVRLYVKITYDVKSGYDRVQSYNYAEQLVNTYIEMLDTNSFRATLSEAIDEKYTAAELKPMISFDRIDDTEMFEANVISKDPKEAKKIADTIAEIAPETISKINDDAQLKIVDEATTPENPVYPDVPRNTAIAFIAGLIIALVIAFFRNYFDVKIKYDEKTTTLAGLPVLAAIPNFEIFANAKNMQINRENTDMEGAENNG